MTNYCAKCKKKISFFDDYWIGDKHYHKKCWNSIPEKKGKEEKLEGIGGWLVYLVIGLCISAIMILYYAITSPLFFNVIYYLWFVYTINIIYLMYEKSRRFKKLAIWWLWLGVGILFIEIIYSLFVLTAEQFTKWIDNYLTDPSLVLRIIGIIGWTIYLLKSERVKNTFVK